MSWNQEIHSNHAVNSEIDCMLIWRQTQSRANDTRELESNREILGKYGDFSEP